MTELLTTRELQTILQVDRTTIYRMADSGRLPAMKVGNQWRFRRDQVEAWLQGSSVGVEMPPSQGAVPYNGSLKKLFPLECVQLIQDSFADALGVMMVVTDLEGKQITRPSNSCGLFDAVEESPAARNRCLDLWARWARDPSVAPRFRPSHLGLLCTRALILVGSEVRAMLVVGGIAPDDWPPPEMVMAQIAADLEVDPALIEQHVGEVHTLSEAGQARVLPFVQRVADILSHIANERNELFGRLQSIAEITQL
ncbi:MAG: PocR ligand-binding domain-containing protein [Chloroflexota bacterium]|nr:PocR ligand-binding domain-containing protein [Chloroflexota bacterium]